MMTKIMSICLVSFLCCSNQLMCDEKQTLQQVLCSGNHVSKSTTLYSDAQVELTGNHNYLECDAATSVKKIIIKANGNHNKAIVNMPWLGEIPEIICSTKNSNYTQVIIYSFKDVKMNHADQGNHNSCRVVSPLRKLIVPAVVTSGAIGLGLLYWNASNKK